MAYSLSTEAIGARRHFPALCPRTFVAQSSLSLPSMLLGLKGAKCLDGAVLISIFNLVFDIPTFQRP